jgi:hypothetical protein
MLINLERRYAISSLGIGKIVFFSFDLTCGPTAIQTDWIRKKKKEVAWFASGQSAPCVLADFERGRNEMMQKNRKKSEEEKNNSGLCGEANHP